MFLLFSHAILNIGKHSTLRAPNLFFQLTAPRKKETPGASLAESKSPLLPFLQLVSAPNH